MVDRHLRPTRFLDADHPSVRDYAVAAVAGADDPLEQARRLYLRVRDDIRYQPYRVSLAAEDMTASACLARGEGFCVPKAVLLAAAGRAVGIPTRLAFADVRNHLATPRLLELIGTDLFVWHGSMQFWLDGRWVKATPAFNLSLCERFGVLPLEFDGVNDSLFQPFDQEGRRHMEYVADHGVFDDLPLAELVAAYRSAYPRWEATAGDFEVEAGEPSRT